MARLAQTEGLTEEQSYMLAAVHDFVAKEIIPNANTTYFYRNALYFSAPGGASLAEPLAVEMES